MSGVSTPHHHEYPWRRVTIHRYPSEALSARHPYEFAVSLFLLMIAANAGPGSLSGLLPLPELAIRAICRFRAPPIPMAAL